MIIILFISMSDSIGNAFGFKKSIRAKIPTILYIFVPNIVPTAILDCFLKQATIPVANSGKEVPKDTKVSPITVSEMFQY